MLLRAPHHVLDAYVLGSPSVPFDPELLEWLTTPNTALTTPNTALIDASGAVRPVQHGAHHAQHDASGAVRPVQHGAHHAQHDASGAVRPAQHGAHHAQHDASGAVRPAGVFSRHQQSSSAISSHSGAVRPAGVFSRDQQSSAAISSHSGAVRPAGVFVAYGEREREPPPPPDAPATQWTSLRANVHRGIPEASHQLAAVLRARGLVVEGAVEIAGEDHTSLKLSLVSRGIGWLINERWATA